MNKLKLSVGVLLLGSLALATNFVACSKSNSAGGTAGATGTAGAAAGTAGAAGGESATLNGKCVPGAFARGTPPVCACQANIPTVCQENCTDTTIDEANCGACNAACLATATCNGSHCGPAATTVLPAITGCSNTLNVANSMASAMNIAVSGGKVYYTDMVHGTVGSVPVAGGAATTVVSGETSPGMIGVTGSTVIWISITKAVTATVDGGAMVTTTTASLRKAALPTGPASDLVVETNTGGGIMGFTFSPDGQTVYYSSGTNVKSIPVAGATAGTIVAMEQLNGIPTALAISSDGKTLAYVTLLNGDVDVVTLGTSPASTNGNMCPANTACCGMHSPADPSGETYLMTNCTRIARSQGSPFFGGIILKDGRAYWSNDGAIESNDATPTALQGNVQVSTTGGMNVTALAGNANNVYFGDSGDMLVFKGIYSLPPDGGMNPDPAHLARGETADSMALDATKVYWSTDDCAILSTPL
jgi:hypothetical protein